LNLYKAISIVSSSYGQSLGIILRKGYKRYIALPILINLLLLILTIWVSIYLGSGLSEKVMQWINLENEGWENFLGILTSILIRVLIFLIYFSVYKYVILILLSPFLSFLSEKVERLKSGKEYGFSFAQLMRDIGRSVVINFRNFIIEIFLTLLLSLLAFLPLIGLISPFLIIFVQSYFFGFALIDYNLERRKIKWRSSEKWMRKNAVTVTLSGLYFHLCFLIPFLGWIIAPVWGVAAGTLTFLRLEEENY